MIFPLVVKHTTPQSKGAIVVQNSFELTEAIVSILSGQFGEPRIATVEKVEITQDG